MTDFTTAVNIPHNANNIVYGDGCYSYPGRRWDGDGCTILARHGSWTHVEHGVWLTLEGFYGCDSAVVTDEQVLDSVLERGTWQADQWVIDPSSRHDARVGIGDMIISQGVVCAVVGRGRRGEQNVLLLRTMCDRRTFPGHSRLTV